MQFYTHLQGKLSAASRVFIDELINNSYGRQKPTCMALARTLAYQANLPDINLQDLSNFYISQTQPDLLNRAYVVNELAPIDIECVKAYAQKFFTLRHNNAYSAQAVFAFRKNSAIVDFFGISRAFSPEDIQVIEANSEQISTHVNGFRILLEELKKED